MSARHDAQAVGTHIGARAVLAKPLDIAELVAQLRAPIRAGHDAASA